MLYAKSDKVIRDSSSLSWLHADCTWQNQINILWLLLMHRYVKPGNGLLCWARDAKIKREDTHLCVYTHTHVPRLCFLQYLGSSFISTYCCLLRRAAYTKVIWKLFVLALYCHGYECKRFCGMIHVCPLSLSKPRPSQTPGNLAVTKTKHQVDRGVCVCVCLWGDINDMNCRVWEGKKKKWWNLSSH